MSKDRNLHLGYGAGKKGGYDGVTIEQLQAENKRLKELLNKALSIVMFPYREPLDKYSDEEQEVIMQKWTVETKDILAAPPQK